MSQYESDTCGLESKSRGSDLAISDITATLRPTVHRYCQQNRERAIVSKNFELKWNMDAVEQLKQQAINQLQEPANDLLRETIRQVNAEMRGRPADETYTVLVTRLGEAFPAEFEPNEPELRKVAEAIEADELDD